MVVTNGQSTTEPNRSPDGVVVVVLFGRETGAAASNETAGKYEREGVDRSFAGFD
jgi:hypothetical protein